MTDEEKAMTSFKKNRCAVCDNKDICNTSILTCYEYVLDYEDAYLAGLAEGKPKWHNLRKDPKDLPNDLNTFVLNQDGEKCRKYPDLWIDIYGNGVTVIAWTDIPKFEE